VVDNWDALANITVFSQAGVEAHSSTVGNFYRQLLYLSTHDIMHGYRHMSSCGFVSERNGCPQLCELQYHEVDVLPFAWRAVFGEDLTDADLPVVYAQGTPTKRCSVDACLLVCVTT
jgi:hypothetical protein